MSYRSHGQKEFPTLECARCGEPFKARRTWARFCSKACRFAAWDKEHPRSGVTKQRRPTNED